MSYHLVVVDSCDTAVVFFLLFACCLTSVRNSKCAAASSSSASVAGGKGRLIETYIAADRTVGCIFMNLTKEALFCWGEGPMPTSNSRSLSSFSESSLSLNIYIYISIGDIDGWFQRRLAALFDTALAHNLFLLCSTAIPLIHL